MLPQCGATIDVSQPDRVEALFRLVRGMLNERQEQLARYASLEDYDQQHRDNAAAVFPSVVLVVDNYSVHTSERVQAERAAFAAAGITLFFLPSYSPELSGIEPLWQDLKHHRMTKRSYDMLGALFRAVDEALTRKAEDLMAARIKPDHPLRAAA